MSNENHVPRPLVECPACRGPLQAVGRLPLSREAAAAGLVTPTPPAGGEAEVALDVYRCHDCGRVEFYDHDFQLAAR